MSKSPDPSDVSAGLKAGLRHDLVILLIPSHDKNNKPLNNQAQWATEALELFSDLFGGATSFQTFKGIYRSETGKDLWDKPILIESYADRELVEDVQRLRKLLEFSRRMKAAMRQESVMLVVNDFRWYL